MADAKKKGVLGGLLRATGANKAFASVSGKSSASSGSPQAPGAAKVELTDFTAPVIDSKVKVRPSPASRKPTIGQSKKRSTSASDSSSASSSSSRSCSF